MMRDNLTHLNKISKEIQDISMGLIMVPIRQTFLKIQRVVRDVSKQLGKIIRLEIKGEDTSVDKKILELLGDPLAHLIRNAIDHGIETNEQRQRAGKSEHGNISICATHVGDQIIITVEDDGGGIDVEKLFNKAKQKGISLPESMSNQEKLNLIFKPGLSIKDAATEISGRGIGMDVVRANIQALHGNLTVESSAEIGTIFKIYLPLTVTIIEGMVAVIGGEKYIIPMNQVSETLNIRRDDIDSIIGSKQVII